MALTKPYVFYVEKRVGALKSAISRTKKEVNLLRIEWVYLNQNARLQELSKKFLPHLEPVEARQLKNLTRSAQTNKIEQ